MGTGDVASFVRVYKATSGKLFGIVVRILGRGELAEEILQEVYLRVWQRAADFNPQVASPVTWLATIARNRALDERRKRQPGRLDDVPDLLEIASDDDIVGQLLETEANERLRMCLDRLEDGHREAIQLIYFEGLTHDEAASRIGQKVTKVRTWIRKGLAELKSCMKHG
ncbi:MAG: sigma-70 family RNA polymerase sigma factor [Hyphomicrobiaceae bacterium]